MRSRKPDTNMFGRDPVMNLRRKHEATSPAGLPLIFATFWFLILAIPLFAVESVALGDSARHVRKAMGSPNRSVDTGDGKILFYGTRMIYITEGTVDFMSSGEFLPYPTRVEPKPEVPRFPSFGKQIEQRSAFVTAHPEFSAAVERAEWALIARLRRAIMRRAYRSVINRDYFVLPLGMISWSHLGTRDADGTRLMDPQGFLEQQSISHYMGVRLRESPPLRLARSPR